MSKNIKYWAIILVIAFLVGAYEFIDMVKEYPSNSETESNSQISSSQNDFNGEYKVKRVVDGDTIIINYNGEEKRVRLIGIDTPESVHPNQDKNVEYGKIASNFTREQLEGKYVTLELDISPTDKYGRLLAYVYLDGKMYNKTLLEKGHAVVATFPPNVKYVDEFKAIEKEAKRNQVGLWKGYAEEKPEVTSKNGTYVGNSNSMKVHTKDCPSAKKIADDNKVWFKTLKEAEEKGYTPCGSCKPE